MAAFSPIHFQITSMAAICAIGSQDGGPGGKDSAARGTLPAATHPGCYLLNTIHKLCTDLRRCKSYGGQGWHRGEEDARASLFPFLSNSSWNRLDANNVTKEHLFTYKHDDQTSFIDGKLL